ncbi:MFS transporter [Nocardia sp. CWNU-33]|uniref:MFS transporter n=1 Tax=Nocardia sp. CWNU-33 TaxID=3392117 RepID=UPI00398E4523
MNTDPKRPALATIAAGCAAGATIENYSVLVYGIGAATVFSDIFFPNENRATALLASFGALAAGFAMRPIGGIIAGHLGDRYGRKPVLVGAFILMALATIAVGCLPTYSQVGFLAPALLVGCRLLQGLGDGAEWGTSVMVTFEHARPGSRGFWSAIPQAGVPLGLLLANAAFLIVKPVHTEWSWRLPFLSVAILLIIGLVLRMKITETPEFENIREHDDISHSPVLEVIKNNWSLILRVIGLRIAETGGFYITTTFLLAFLSGASDTSGVGLLAICIGAAISLFAHPLFGHMSDIYGRRTVYLWACAFTAAFGFPAMLLATSGSSVAVVAAVAMGLVFSHAALAGVQGAWFAELFPTRTRTSGASLGYQLTALIAGLVPLTATALDQSVGWAGVAALFSAFGVISGAVALSTPDRALRASTPTEEVHSIDVRTGTVR